MSLRPAKKTCESCVHSTEHGFGSIYSAPLVMVYCKHHQNWICPPIPCDEYTEYDEDEEAWAAFDDYTDPEFATESDAIWTDADRQRALDILGEPDGPHAMEDTAIELVAARAELKDIYESLSETERLLFELDATLATKEEQLQAVRDTVSKHILRMVDELVEQENAVDDVTTCGNSTCMMCRN